MRVVDELPDVLFYKLNNDQAMRLIPLPEIEEDPKDELSKAFRDALANARIVNMAYLDALEKISPDSESSIDDVRKIERELKDEVRKQLSLPARPKKAELNLAQHARNNGITPSYDLPTPGEEATDGRHTDNDIQTLQLPKDLERKLNSISSKCRTWIQETGINVLHVAFGFLEWAERDQTETSFAPLILLSASLEKRRSQAGVTFHISGGGDEPQLNAVLIEKLRAEFGIEIPPFDGLSVENYLEALSEIAPRQISWKVRRQVAIGVFPSARMAMYYDIDPKAPDFVTTTIVGSLLGGTSGQSTSPFAEDYEVDKPEFEHLVPHLVLDADSSQVSALIDVASGKNLALEGPPGTGKSQTIVNLIAAALIGGKKVLFIAEKLAALDVVRSRLEAIGLGDYLLTLQAERSSRERVFNSLRDRIEMDIPKSVKDFDEQIAKYRSVRDEISTYITLMTSEFESTGLNVYQIISKSIATSPFLTGIPNEVLSKLKPAEAYRSRRGIAQLRELAENVSKAFNERRLASKHWQDIGPRQIDKFSAEEILGTAGALANKYDEICQLRNMLPNLGLDQHLNVETGKQLADALSQLREVRGDNGSSFLKKVLHADNCVALEKFLAACDEYQEKHEALCEVLAAPPSSDALESISELAKLASDVQLDALNPTAMDADLQLRSGQVNDLESYRVGLRSLIEFVPQAANWSSFAIGTVKTAASWLGGDALSHRFADFSETGQLKHLNDVLGQIVALRQEKAKLADAFHFEVSISPQKLEGVIATLQSARILAFLSKEYREAKSIAQSLVKLSSQKDSVLLVQLRSLHDYLRREFSLLRDSRLQELLGLNFKTIENNLEPYQKLAGFQKFINDNFPGPEFTSLRQFLGRATTKDLELFPIIPEGIKCANFDELNSTIKIQKAALLERSARYPRIKALLSTFNIGYALNITDVLKIQAALAQSRDLESQLTRQTKVANIIGDKFAGPYTKTTNLHEIASWGRKYSQLEGELASVLDVGFTDQTLDVLNNLIDAHENTESLSHELKLSTDIDVRAFNQGKNLEFLRRHFSEATADHEGLFSHSSFAVERVKIFEAVGGFGEWKAEDAILFDNLPNRCEALATREIAKAVTSKLGSKLNNYNGTRLDDLRAKLRALDKLILDLTQKHLKSRIYTSARPPAGSGYGRKSSWTEMALVNNEIGKQQRFISVRDLTQRAPRALLELKPCWMMSPLAVAQYAPKKKIEFDLCIIDEASQMPPESAIGALLRSKQTVVVGDTNQLPPSSFFQKMLDEDESDEDIAVFEESILELANSTFRPPRRLKWHYRSRHSALIRFSNRLVYDDDLVVFQSATESNKRMGVFYKKVDGLYKSGTNVIEARTVVDAILDFMKSDPDRSLGVVTLNQKQRDLIIEEFEQAMASDRVAQAYIDSWKTKSDGLEEFFIKNLENVQGDERDVMFISTVYGPETAGGRVAQRFGPINGMAGKRRLNVLFSRAKEKIVTYSSMTAADIIAEETNNPGTHMLMRWLEYSATGHLDSGAVGEKEPDSDFEQFVIDQLKSMGCDPVPQVGVAGYSIDIGVKHPSWPHGYILAVECDGVTYHSAKSARDRDRIRQEHLEGLGWHFHRIWSTDWFNNPRREIERLKTVVESRLKDLKAREADYLHVQTPSTGSGASKSLIPAIIRPLAPKEVPSSVVGARAHKPVRKSVSIGDLVKVRFLDGDKRSLQLSISKTRSDVASGVIHSEAPIAKALLGAEEGEEVDILVGSVVKKAMVESIETMAQT